MPSPPVILAALLAVCFTLATRLQPHALAWGGKRAQDGGSLAALLGDGRRLFANHFFTKADVYFHSGYYPSIFDVAQTNRSTAHLSGHEGHDEHGDHEGHEAHDGHKEQSTSGGH